MKLFVRISVIILAGAGIVLSIFPVAWLPPLSDIRYKGWAGIAGAVLILFLPSLVRPSEKNLDFNRKSQAADLFQSLLIFVFIGNALGGLGLYKLHNYGFEFDKVLHFFTPFLGVVIISFVLSGRWGIRRTRAIPIALVIIIGLGIAWEIYEVLVDFLFKTHISGAYGLNVSRDTKFDLLFDILGSASGAIASVYFWQYFSGTANINKIKIIKGVISALILAIAIGFYAAYMKM